MNLEQFVKCGVRNEPIKQDLGTKFRYLASLPLHRGKAMISMLHELTSEDNGGPIHQLLRRGGKSSSMSMEQAWGKSGDGNPRKLGIGK